jgi:CRISPR/Cas system CMR-associated protein Cmr1 (group 7 of RAMP superfamily)
MDETTRRKNSTLNAMVQIAEATIKHSKDPQRVAEARAHLESLMADRLNNPDGLKVDVSTLPKGRTSDFRVAPPSARNVTPR